MSCCGSKRQTFLPHYPTITTSGGETPVVFVKFRYTGQRSMAVTGGMTGQRYRFPNPGDEVMIDGRDASGMAAVPNVERVFD